MEVDHIDTIMRCVRGGMAGSGGQPSPPLSLIPRYIPLLHVRATSARAQHHRRQRESPAPLRLRPRRRGRRRRHQPVEEQLGDDTAHHAEPLGKVLLPPKKSKALGRPGAGFNGRVNGYTHVDSARPVADQ